MNSVIVAVDARPLSQPMTGIGYYTRYLVAEMIRETPQWQWIFYSDRPLEPNLFDNYSNVKFRVGNSKPRLTSTIYAQMCFPIWALLDGVSVFWSPRHHLPLMLGRKILKAVTIHDLVWSKYPETMSRFGELLDRLLMPISVRKADLVFCVSNSTKNDLNSILDTKARQGIVSPASKLEMNIVHDSNVPPAESYFLFVGTNEPRKNLGRLIEAFSYVLQRGVKIRKLVVIGMKGWGAEELCSAIERFDVRSFVEVTGYLSEEELIEYYRYAHALLLPSLYEGFGMPLVEAMAFGVPVITSNCSSMPEVAGDAAIYVDPCSVDSIAFALKSMSDDKVLRNQLSKNALLKASEYSWSRSAKKMISLIEDCVRDS